MIWKIIILLLGTFSTLYAFPYGKWEYNQKNKSGGILTYIVAIICITLCIVQLYI